MRPIFPTKELEEENERLLELFLSTKENVDVDEFLEQNASEAYKKYVKDDEAKREKLFEQGILI